MKAAVLYESFQPLVVEDLELDAPHEHEVLVKLTASGVCHSDLHLRDGFFNLGEGKRLDLSKGRELPLTLGHEIAGTVVALGPAAGGVEVGARRVVYPWIGCGGCPTCQAGQEHLCARSRALGVTRPGGFSDHVLVPHPRYLFDFGDRPVTLACTYACSGLTAYGAVRKVLSRVEGQPLVIIGLGGVGFAALRLAQAVTTASIIAVDVDRETLQAAAETGAMSRDLSGTLRAGYTLALGLRLQRHAELFAAGESLSNHVDPAALDPWVRAELKEYFKAVRVAQEHVASTYLVGMLG